MKTFKEFLFEETIKYKGTFCFHKENHYLSTDASSKEDAFKKMCYGLGKKLKRPVETYFRSTPNSYQIKEVK